MKSSLNANQQKFAKLVQIEDIHNELGVSQSTVRFWRNRINDRPYDPSRWSIKDSRIKELLGKASEKIMI